MKISRSFLRLVPWALLLGILGGVVFAAIGPGTAWISGLVGGGLMALSILGLGLVWRGSPDGRSLAVILMVVFLLRLVVGIALHLLLPIHGDDEPVQNAGYIFYDAWQRDQQSWQLAQSGQPLFSAFGSEFYSDQYGGLLWLGALIYRVLSPDAQRPLLMVILGAFTAAVGVAFLVRAIQPRFGGQLALAAGWIYALYPESILLGSSQMREPFLMGLSAVAWWAVTALPRQRKRRGMVVTLVATVLGLLVLSWRAALPILLALALWFVVDTLLDRLKSSTRWMMGGVLLVSVLVLGLLSWRWFSEAGGWDLRLMETSSGMLTTQLAKLPESLQAVFLIIYGLTQPVLPAAMFETALPIRTVISVGRALGWYALAPLLLAAGVTLWQVPDRTQRRLLMLTAAFSAAWILVSSFRAGGDLWDNPRYRTIMMIWLAFLAGWAWLWARQKRSPWLWRILAIEGIFLAFFIHWYLSRYLSVWQKMPLFPMLGAIALGAVLVVGGGLIWDHWRSHHPPRKTL
ncbi:MAG TPA: hypothetical protein PKG95_07700 [Anaerolineaceae bacterium]|jgi:ABC-type multidrug transport system fused ATPase/permease subunit|nr:hypothetical protein [Anaerolineaceae bacterium]